MDCKVWMATERPWKEVCEHAVNMRWVPELAMHAFHAYHRIIKIVEPTKHSPPEHITFVQCSINVWQNSSALCMFDMSNMYVCMHACRYRVQQPCCKLQPSYHRKYVCGQSWRVALGLPKGNPNTGKPWSGMLPDPGTYEGGTHAVED